MSMDRLSETSKSFAGTQTLPAFVSLRVHLVDSLVSTQTLGCYFTSKFPLRTDVVCMSALDFLA